MRVCLQQISKQNIFCPSPGRENGHDFRAGHGRPHCPRPAGPLSRSSAPRDNGPRGPGSWGALHRDHGPGWPGHQDLMGRTTRGESPARREPGSLRNKAGLSTSHIHTATSPVSQEGQALAGYPHGAQAPGAPRAPLKPGGGGYPLPLSTVFPQGKTGVRALPS